MLEHSQLDLGASLPHADLCEVGDARGLIVLVHADGGTQTAHRAQPMLLRFQARGFSTLDLDLLAPSESGEDLSLLARRLDEVLDRLPARLQGLPLALLASGTGTAAALVVAARRRPPVRALMSRSGRPHLAEAVLGDLRVPTLLLVGAADPELVELNRSAFQRLRCDKRIDVVPGATRHFLEAGTLDVAAQLAADWFESQLGAPLPI
jgi:pimeloyl-ACP methyl ester carboxylesterase